eukprot:1924231-Amphidinium_carterae.1
MTVVAWVGLLGHVLCLPIASVCKAGNGPVPPACHEVTSEEAVEEGTWAVKGLPGARKAA